jgi:hypothetical protein
MLQGPLAAYTSTLLPKQHCLYLDIVSINAVVIKVHLCSRQDAICSGSIPTQAKFQDTTDVTMPVSKLGSLVMSTGMSSWRLVKYALDRI